LTLLVLEAGPEGRQAPGKVAVRQRNGKSYGHIRAATHEHRAKEA